MLAASTFCSELIWVMILSDAFGKTIGMNGGTKKKYLDLTSQRPLVESILEVQQLLITKQPLYIYLDRNNITCLTNDSFFSLNKLVIFYLVCEACIRDVIYTRFLCTIKSYPM